MLTGMQTLIIIARMRLHTTTAFTTKIKCDHVRHYPKKQFSTASSLRAAETTILYDQQLLQDMLYRIRQVRHVPNEIRDSLLEFRVDGIKLGQVRPNIAKLLCSFNIDNTTTSNGSNGAAFAIEWDDDSRSYLTLTEMCGRTFKSRTEAISKEIGRAHV